MNDESTPVTPSPDAPTAPTNQGGSSASRVRLMIWLVILVVMAGALAYDRFVALRGFKRATRILDTIIAGGEDPQPTPAATKTDEVATDDAEKGESAGSDTAMAPPAEEESLEASPEKPDSEKQAKKRRKKRESIVFGRADIRKALGIQPALEGKAAEAPSKLPSRLLGDSDPKAWANKHGYWELYRWRRGLPFQYYELIVIYTGPNEPLFSNYVGGVPLAPSEFSGVALPTFDPDNVHEPHGPVMAGMGDAPGKKKGGKKGAKKGHAHSHGPAGANKKAPAKTGGDKKAGGKKDAEVKPDKKPQPKKEADSKKDSSEKKQ